ncbi:hypothetical protein AF335_24600 [Streptomyces eurocidicus]|uniref:Trypsin-co-occurring domain-containing protein n=1 Tax=Streptomyces eurocidicus TaxID=66423 RepID=A0A2N8NR29_STREU|nr:CU044_2847 family protein [Streptomyces eurocidicus]MBB5117015.1 hypothetical protein [Streptomyces eurocidicus]PNE31228.1 hypothetical protein AF335_24600 [Streptomyces eurocidicus]
MADGIARVRLDDGTVVWARITEAHELEKPGGPGADGSRGGYEDSGGALAHGGYEDSSAAGAARRVAGMAGGLSDVVRGVVGSLRMGLAAAAPQEVKVDFGIELSAKAGQVISLLADGEGKASINVSLTWSETRPDEERAAQRDAAPGRPTTPGAP